MSSDDPSSVPVEPRSILPAAIAAAGSGVDVDAALAALLDAVAAGLQPAMSAILVQDPDRPGLDVAASTGMDEAALEGVRTAAADPSDPFAETATGRTATFDRAGVSPVGLAYVGSYLPLLATTGGVEVALGTFGIAWPAPHASDAAEREVLQSIATLAALIVDRARLGATAAERSEWFERMAHTDPLTGLANERTVGRVLELELARAGRQGSEVSLALFDVDDFRATNADSGHDVGDDVLRRVASVLAESVRLVDTVGRIGGDEFVLVAPGAAGGMVARRVLDGIEALPTLAGRPVSVSAGVARFPVDGTDSDSLIAAATDALQRAKGAGRGNVAEGETESVPES